MLLLPPKVGWTVPKGKIVFSVREAGRSLDLFVMDDDGTNLRRLTRTPGSESSPSWSPMRIPNRREVDVKSLYLIDVATKQLMKLKAVPKLIDGLAWAPDGESLLYVIGGPDWAEFQFLDVKTKQTKQINLADLGLALATIFYAPSWIGAGGRVQGVHPQSKFAIIWGQIK
ncbi:MAG: TolB family protein, partial [Candidatus Poribacteria bacterium]